MGTRRKTSRPRRDVCSSQDVKVQFLLTPITGLDVIFHVHCFNVLIWWAIVTTGLQRLKPVHTAYCGMHNLGEIWSWARDDMAETEMRPRRDVGTSRDRDVETETTTLLLTVTQSTKLQSEINWISYYTVYYYYHDVWNVIKRRCVATAVTLALTVCTFITVSHSSLHSKTCCSTCCSRQW